MTVTQLVPQLWTARMYHAFRAYNPWLSISLDLSPRLQAAGADRVNIPYYGASRPTFGNYSKTVDITYQALVPERQQLVANQDKYWAVEIDDIDEAQSEPNLIDSFAFEAMSVASEAFNTTMRSGFDNALPAARKRATKSWTNQAAFDASGLGNIVDIFLQEQGEALKGGWPADLRYAVVDPVTYTYLVEYLVDKGNGGDPVQERAWLNADVSRALGWNIVVDGHDAGSGNSFKTKTIRLGLRNYATVTAVAFHEVEGLRSTTHFADLLRGRMQYGGTRLRDDYCRSAAFTLP